MQMQVQVEGEVGVDAGEVGVGVEADQNLEHHHEGVESGSPSQVLGLQTITDRVMSCDHLV